MNTAGFLDRSAINFAEGFVKVGAQTAKVRQRRVVYPLPMALTWLRQAKKLGSKLPPGIQGRIYCLLNLRDVLDWPQWKQDCTRHTAASNWLADSRSAADVATSLGNSETILRRHDMALLTKKDAEKFWKLAP